MARAAGGFRQDFHTLRAIAITLIVGAHTLPALDWRANPVMFRIIDVICNESSVMFFFIAGFLFHHLAARFEYPAYLRNKFFTVIVPYLIVSVPAIILFVYFIPKHNAPWGTDPAWYQILMFYVTGRHLAPLWFVPTITLFYLLAPAFLLIDRKARWVYWSLPFFLALSVYLGRDSFWGPIGKAAYLFPAYLGGIFISHYRVEAERFVKEWLWPLAGLSLAIYALMVAEVLPKSTHIILKLLWAMLLLHALRQVAARPMPWSDYLGDISFGVFFVHAYLIGFVGFAITRLGGGTYATGQDAVIPASLALYLVFTAIVLGLSVGMIWMAQKMLGRNSRMVVGA